MKVCRSFSNFFFRASKSRSRSGALSYPLWVQQALQEFTGKNLVGNLTLYYVPNWMEQSELSGTQGDFSRRFLQPTAVFESKAKQTRVAQTMHAFNVMRMLSHVRNPASKTMSDM